MKYGATNVFVDNGRSVGIFHFLEKESLYNNGISRFCSASFQVAGRSNALCCPMTSGYETRSGNLIIVILNVCDKLINSVYVVRGDP